MNPPSFLLPSASAHSAAAETTDEERALLAEQALEETATLPADLGTSGYDVVPQTSGHGRSD